MQARAADIKDVAERVVNILCGRHDAGDLGEEPGILIARDLAPSETVQMDKSKLLAFVTELGSANSHTAILARTMNIPALMGVPVGEELDGRGHSGRGERNTDCRSGAPGSRQYEKKQEEERQRELLQTLKNKEDVTLDGKHIRLYANIGSVGIRPKCWPTTPMASAYSAVNSCIWKKATIPRKKSSSRRTRLWRRQWPERK